MTRITPDTPNHSGIVPPDLGADPALVNRAQGRGPSGFDRGELLALAERVEGASGPDRELDGGMAAACGFSHGKAGGWCNDHSGDYWEVDECAPQFTASIDAAMTLVLKGHHASLHANHDDESRARTYTSTDDGSFCYAATPALALCAAALRARAAIAIEARRAETTKIGSVHESAVGNADAPESTPPVSHPEKD